MSDINPQQKRTYHFEKYNNEDKIENIHVFEVGADIIGQFVYTRDYLISHPDRAKQYSVLKNQLKDRFPDDYQAYRDGKHDFLQETERLAREWKKATKSHFPLEY